MLSPKASPTSPKEQQFVELKHKWNELKELFPDWERMALLDVLKSNDGDVCKSAETIITWSAGDGELYRPVGPLERDTEEACSQQTQHSAPPEREVEEESEVEEERDTEEACSQQMQHSAPPEGKVEEESEVEEERDTDEACSQQTQHSVPPEVSTHNLPVCLSAFYDTLTPKVQHSAPPEGKVEEESEVEEERDTEEACSQQTQHSVPPEVSTHNLPVCLSAFYDTLTPKVQHSAPPEGKVEEESEVEERDTEEACSQQTQHSVPPEISTHNLPVCLSAFYDALTPEEKVDEEHEFPDMLQRAGYDDNMRGRLVRHVTPSQFVGATMKAISVFKRKATAARQYVATLSSSPSTSTSPTTAAKIMSREEEIVAERVLLDQRMKHLRLVMVAMEDDGNCQFRAISQELFGKFTLFAVSGLAFDSLSLPCGSFTVQVRKISTWKCAIGRWHTYGNIRHFIKIFSPVTSSSNTWRIWRRPDAGGTSSRCRQSRTCFASRFIS
jgi:hypothetical protein